MSADYRDWYAEGYDAYPNHRAKPKGAVMEDSRSEFYAGWEAAERDDRDAKLRVQALRNLRRRNAERREAVPQWA